MRPLDACRTNHHLQTQIEVIFDVSEAKTFGTKCNDPEDSELINSPVCSAATINPDSLSHAGRKLKGGMQLAAE